MKIDYHISQLLYRYQCVTVPGFGAFLAETLSANIQETNQTFNPPKKIISFNPHLKNNDGLLANHISLAEKISYDQAVLIIENEVFFWKNELEKNHTLTLKTIGSFKLNQENNLFFSPANDLNYLTSSFGLSAFVSPTIKREVFLQSIKNNENEIIFDSILLETEAEEFQHRRYFNPYLKYASIFILSFGMVALGYSSYVSKLEEKETILVQREVQKEVENKIQEATFFIDSPVLKINGVTAAIKTFPFHAMAGSFRNADNANKTLQRLISLGYNARILRQNKDGLFPVVYGSFATYTEAQYKINQIQNSTNTDAWLLIEDL